MSVTRTLAVVDSPYNSLNAAFDRLIAKLEPLGHRILRFADREAFAADRAAWGQIDALMSIGTVRVDDAFLEAAPRLRAALSIITGIEGYDLAACTRHGVAVGNGTPFEGFRSIAEGTVLMVLAALYDFNGKQKLLRDDLPRPLHVNARMLHGKTVGFVGFGRIARETAQLLAPWGVTMQYASPRPSRSAIDTVPHVELEALLRGSDVVVLLANLNDETRGLMNAERLGWMKKSAFLVNMARGPLCDEAALYRCLRDGGIAGAALDTFEVEPLPAASPLRELPNVILTPHMIGHTVEGHEALETTAFESAKRVLGGETPLCVQNPEVLAAWQARWAA